MGTPNNKKPWGQSGVDRDFPRYDREPRIYLIASEPRTGSHLLAHALYLTGELGAPLEYLNPSNLKCWKQVLKVKSNRAVLQRLFPRRTSPSGWFGVKSHWPHYQAHLQEAMVLNIQRTIRISRKDRIAQAVSLAIAKQTGKWSSAQAVQNKAIFSSRLVDSALREIEEQRLAWDAHFAQRGVTPFEVAYEDLAANPQSVVDAILASFDLPQRNVSVEESEKGPRQQTTTRNERWRDAYLRELDRRRASESVDQRCDGE